VHGPRHVEARDGLRAACFLAQFIKLFRDLFCVVVERDVALA